MDYYIEQFGYNSPGCNDEDYGSQDEIVCMVCNTNTHKSHFPDHIVSLTHQINCQKLLSPEDFNEFIIAINREKNTIYYPIFDDSGYEEELLQESIEDEQLRNNSTKKAEYRSDEDFDIRYYPPNEKCEVNLSPDRSFHFEFDELRNHHFVYNDTATEVTSPVFSKSDEEMNRVTLNDSGDNLSTNSLAFHEANSMNGINEIMLQLNPFDQDFQKVIHKIENRAWTKDQLGYIVNACISKLISYS